MAAEIVSIVGCFDAVGYCPGCHWFSPWHAIVHADMPRLRAQVLAHNCHPRQSTWV